MIRRGSHDASQAFDDAWNQRGRATSHDAEVRDLVHTAELLCRSAAAEPSAEFRTSLRERLMTEAADVLVTRPAPVRAVPASASSPRTPRRRRRAAVLAAAAVAALGSVGTIASSASAVPGDLLYPVKRGVENVQVALHRDDASRGEYRLEQARERLAEAQYLDQKGDAERLASTLDDFSSQAASGTDDLFDAYEAEGSQQSIDTVNDFVAEASVALAGMSSSVPGDARESYTSANSLVSSVAQQASGLCATCSPIQLSSLADIVQSLVGSVVPASEDPKDDAAETDANLLTGTTPPESTGGTGTTPLPTPGKVITDAAKGVDGLVGGTVDSLLGEDGLVPSLLNGLLGGKR